jgi:hypothetical protein
MFPINFNTENELFSNFLNDKATSANIEKIRDFYNITKTKQLLINNANSGKYILHLKTNNTYIYNSLCLNKNDLHLEILAKNNDETFKKYFLEQKIDIAYKCHCGEYQIILDFNKKYEKK